MIKRKKRVKMRGSHTHGWGHKKKHRGKGSKGGAGGAGIKKHRKHQLWKSGRRTGKRGFKSLAKRGLTPAARTINLNQLAGMEGKELDMRKLGYEKVLGWGEIGRPVTVKAESFSRKAEEKIKKAGGKAVSYGEPEKTEAEKKVS